MGSIYINLIYIGTNYHPILSTISWILKCLNKINCINKSTNFLLKLAQKIEKYVKNSTLGRGFTRCIEKHLPKKKIALDEEEVL